MILAPWRPPLCVSDFKKNPYFGIVELKILSEIISLKILFSIVLMLWFLSKLGFFSQIEKKNS